MRAPHTLRSNVFLGIGRGLLRWPVGFRSTAAQAVTAENAKSRRAINKHLLAFSRIVSELAQVQENGSAGPGLTKLISA